MEVDENSCKYCNEILDSDVIEEVKSFEELAIELKNSRPSNVEYNEENKLRTSGIIKWLLQNATEQTIDESDIEKIVDHCLYSEESEIIDILKSRGVFIVVHREIDITRIVDFDKFAANEVIWKKSAIYHAVKKGTPEIMAWILGLQVNADLVHNVAILNKLLENAGVTGNLNTIKKLLELGANIDHYEEDEFHTIFEMASQNGHYHVLEWLLSKFIPYSLHNALIVAISEKHLDVIKFLVELKSFDMNDRNLLGENFIHIAASTGNISVIKYLMHQGTELLAKDEDGSTAVHFAAENGHLNLLKWLTGHGALEYTRNYKYSPINYAALKGHLDCVKYLVHNNFDVNSVTWDGSVLHFAAKSGNIEIVRFLVSHGANPLVIDDDQNTLLHVSQKLFSNRDCDKKTLKKETNLNMVKLLVSYGVNIHDKNKFQETVFTLASKHYDLETVFWLVEQGMDVQELLNLNIRQFWIHYCSIDKDWRLLHLCIKYLKNDINQAIHGESLLYSFAQSPEAVKILIDNNADVNLKNVNDHSTPLIESLSSRYDSDGSAALILLEHGADVNVESNHGRSALYCAILNNKNINVIKKLIELGADVNAGNRFKKYIILHAAVLRGDLDIIQCLVEAGVDVNCTDSDNNSAICITLDSDHTNKWNIIQYLVKNGANVIHFTRHRNPIILEAIKTGDVELVSLVLLQYGANNLEYRLSKRLIHYCTYITDENNKLKVLKLLVNHGAIISINKRENILLSCIHNLEIVEYLLTLNINVNRKNKFGSTPLLVILSQKCESEKEKENQIKIAIKLIKHHGININCKDSHGTTPLHLAVCTPHLSDVARLLVEKGANVNALRNDGGSILHRTCVGELGTWLINKGADVNAKNNLGVTVLQDALTKLYDKEVFCNQNIVNTLEARTLKNVSIPGTALASIHMSRYVEYIHVLIDTVRDVNTVNKQGLNALHYVVSTGNIDLLDHLFKKGAIVISRTNKGNSVLHLAVCSNKVNIVEYLLKEQNHELLFKGNNTNETPLDIAVKKKHVGIIKILLNHSRK